MDESVEIVNDALCDTYTDFISIVSSSFSLSAGVSININNTKALSLNGKFSRESYKYENQMKTSDVASGFSRKWWALYSLESNPYPIMPLASGFKAFLSYIPATISNAADQKKYNLLVQVRRLPHPVVSPVLCCAVLCCACVHLVLCVVRLSTTARIGP